MRAKPSLASRLTMAALISALAAVLMVAVGPGLADKPDDAGTPNEHASEQAQESTSDDGSDTTASEESTDASADETADTTASEDATEVAATDTAEHVPPGQEKKEDSSGEEGSTDEAVLGATSDPSTTAANSQGSDKVNEDTSQTGLPRGQSEDECTNEHHGDDNDFSGHGANQHGLYDNTCDGRASENGSGGGNATGRPCMGCVGNADDKNPKGQSPNHLGGKDHNAGYECDRNKGVGQGNPAHTDCRPTDVITICHSDDDGDTWRVITDTRDDIEDILAEDGPQFAFVVAAGTDPDDCEDDDDDETFDVCHVNTATGERTILENLSRADFLTHVPGHAADFEIKNNGDRNRCVNEDKVTICHRTGPVGWQIKEIPTSALGGHLGHGDKVVPAGTTEAECEDEDELFRICDVQEDDDFDVVNNLTRAQVTAALAADSRDFEIFNDRDVDRCDDNERRRPDDDTICHSLDGETWSVITDDENDIDDHLRDDPFDFRVSRGTDADDCDEEIEVCPEGTDLEGEAMPDDRECDIPPVVNPGAKLCPSDSDMAGLPVPEGVLANCWPPSVLPGLVERPAKPVVAPGQIPGRPPTEQPGVLPFTGASVLAFLVLALQLIAAGTLILRGKKA